MSILKNFHPEWKKHLKDDGGAQMMQLVLGSNIYHRRKYRGMSQSDLAEQAKITQSIVSELENGDYNPSLELLGKIAQALQIDFELLNKKHISWKMIEAIDYLAAKIKDLDTLKAMKLIFLIDFESLQKSKEKLIGLDYLRRNRGPFSKEIYDAEEIFAVGKHLKYQPIHFDTYLVLGRDDKKFIDMIVEKYGHMSGPNLMEYTYKLEPMKGCSIGGNERMGEKIL